MAVSGPTILPLTPTYLDLSTVVCWWPVDATYSKVRLVAVDDSEDGEDDGVNDEFTMMVATASFTAAYQAWVDQASGTAPTADFTDPLNSQYVAIFSHFN